MVATGKIVFAKIAQRFGFSNAILNGTPKHQSLVEKVQRLLLFIRVVIDCPDVRERGSFTLAIAGRAPQRQRSVVAIERLYWLSDGVIERAHTIEGVGFAADVLDHLPDPQSLFIGI